MEVLDKEISLVRNFHLSITAINDRHYLCNKKTIFLLDEFSSALDDNAQIIKSNLIKANKTIIYKK